MAIILPYADNHYEIVLQRPFYVLLKVKPGARGQVGLQAQRGKNHQS